MRPVTVTTAGVSVSAPIPLNYLTSPFNIGFGVVVTGAATYTVQHTFDDVFSPTFVAASATWFDHSSVAGKTVNFDGNYAYPIRAARVNQTAGAGSTSAVFIQAGLI